MKRKKVIMIIAIVIGVVGIGLILFSKKTIPFDNIKNDLIMKNKEINNNEITTVDVTNIVTGNNINHQHVYKSNYNSNEHWNECIICKEKNNIVKHSFTTTWILGYESCGENNYYTKTCSCGYSETGRKPCVWDGRSYKPHTGFVEYQIQKQEEYSNTHTRKCSICGEHIFYKYYMNQYGSGEIYDLTPGKNGNYAEYCCDGYGNRLTCNNPGNCTKCGRWVDEHNSFYIDVENGTFRCYGCDEIWGTVKYKNNIDNSAPALNQMVFDFELYDPYTLWKFEYGAVTDAIPHELYQSYSQELTNVSEDKKKFTIIVSLKLKPEVKMKQYIESYFYINDVESIVASAYAYQDRIAPEIKTINADGGLTEWSKTKPITINGTENYCDNVNVKIVELQNEENIIFKGNAIVNSNNYSITCTPEIETGLIGKKYKCIVTDTCGNSTEKEFEIAKIDSMGPHITSNDKVSEEWAKEKIFTATATDIGIGEVQIAFNNEEDYKIANSDGTNFTRDYKIIGDVYKPKQAIILYKDGLGNISSKELTIDKLDNTAPTITNVELHNNKLIITSNDIKEGIGEGSGITKYRYITSDTKIDNPVVTEDNIEVGKEDEIQIKNVSKVKYIYIVAEDLVGNVSNVYEYEVPQLVITSKVNSDYSITLNWENYEIQNKYFVIYRKKENSDTFETVVDLSQKLCDNKYIDKLAIDEEAPSKPNINIETVNETIKVNSISSDTGTKYTYYIESYDSSTNKLVAISSQINEII